MAAEHVTHPPLHIRQPHRLLPLPGLFDHGRSNIDSRNVPGDCGHRTSDKSRATGHIQYRILGADSRRLDDQSIGVLVVVVRHLGERHRLFGELLHN